MSDSESLRAIDAVVNIWTEEALSHRPDWGDDFFVGFKGYPHDQVVSQVSELVHRFQLDVESFYDEAARQRRYIVARDRDGVERRLPLLSASAAIVELPRGHQARSEDEIAGLIAVLKKTAKQSPDRIASACYAGAERWDVTAS
jgi:hypothetical protein